MRPSSSVVVATSCSSCDRSSTSVGTTTARRPTVRTRAATSSRSAGVRAASTRSAPASASATAMPAPMPLPAPVTMATRSVSRNRSRITPSPFVDSRRTLERVLVPVDPSSGHSGTRAVRGRHGADMALRVIQWATGNVGRAAIEGVVGHPELELVGCWVHSADKDGVDAGSIAGIDPIGVAASTDKDAVLAIDADCVVYAPMLANEGDVRMILGAGKSVVTPVGWVYPFASRDVAELEAICRDAGVVLHGSGIHPGGITERFPLMLSSLCTSIR